MRIRISTSYWKPEGDPPACHMTSFGENISKKRMTVVVRFFEVLSMRDGFETGGAMPFQVL